MYANRLKYNVHANVNRLGKMIPINNFSHESPPCFEWLNPNSIFSLRYTKFILSLKTKRETKRRKGFHLHHIRPKHYFKDNGMAVDNSEQNLVSLSPREHAIAHYLLYKSTQNFKDRWALCRMLRDTSLKYINTRFLDKYRENPEISEETRIKMKNAWEKRKSENRASPWNKNLKGDPKQVSAAQKAWNTRRANNRDKMSQEQKDKISKSVSNTKKDNPKTKESAKKAWITRKSKQDDIVETM